jgi:hypothetical protein
LTKVFYQTIFSFKIQYSATTFNEQYSGLLQWQTTQIELLLLIARECVFFFKRFILFYLSAVFLNSNNQLSPRTELLHNIDPLYKEQGKQLYPNTFDTRVRAAIRVGDLKLITGDPGISLLGIL